MQTAPPKLIEFVDQDGIPIELELCQEKDCTCGEGIARWTYHQVKCAAHYWHAQHWRSIKREDTLKQELELAQAEIRLLKQRIYGKSAEVKKKSEGLIDQKSARKRGQQPGSQGHGRIEHNLEELEEIIELPLDERCCATCQQPYEELSVTEDSEIIEIAVKGYCRKIKRKKYRSSCRCKGTRKLLTAPSIPRLIPKGKIGTSIWASLLMDKYGGHTPTNNYLNKLQWYGIELAQGTVTDGLKKIVPLLSPIVQSILKKSQKEKHWHADETRWEVFEEVEGKVSSRWYLWIFKSTSAVYYNLSPSRGYRVPKDFFADVKEGILSCDRYVVYKKVESSGVVILALCWAHVRRDFLNVGKGYPEFREWSHTWVEKIGLLYKLNKERLQATDERMFNSVHERLKSHLDGMEVTKNEELNSVPRHPAKHSVLKSLSNHWKGLIVFLEHPEIPMDNNEAERGLRGPVTGRKNYYGSGSIWSAELAAAMFSIIQTVKLWDLNPLTWLYHYLECCLHNNNKPPENLEQFLPWSMNEERKKTITNSLCLFPGLDSS